MSDGDSYVGIRVRLLKRLEKSIYAEPVDNPAGISPKWIPRSLIHGADDLALGNTKNNTEIVIRVFAWKARQIGFLSIPVDEQTELFA